jgi:hypothetical protein
MNLLKSTYILPAGIILILALFILQILSINNTIFRNFQYNTLQLVSSWQNDLRTREFNTLVTEHYQIRYLPIDQDYIDMVAEVAELAYQEVSEEMQQKPAKTVTLTIYPDTKTLAENYGWDKDEKALGVYWAGNIGILSPRAWVQEENSLEQFKYFGPMTHEFAHLLVDEISKGNYNRWWTEGVAQYIEKKIINFEFDTPASLKNQEFYSLSEMEKNFDKLDQSIVYWQSLKAVEYIVSVYGENAIYVIMNNLGNGDNMPLAINKAINLDQETFANNYYEYLRAQSEV